MKTSVAVFILSLAMTLAVSAQQAPPRPPARPTAPPATPPAAPRGNLPDTPIVLDADNQKIKVTAIKGLQNPWALALLPNLDILVTERAGRLRIIRGGVLDYKPVVGVPEVNTGAIFAGLMDIALHPNYAQNKLIYFTYSKGMPGNPFPDTTGTRDAATVTLVRARYDGGNELKDVKELFQSNSWAQGTSGSRLAFAKDGKIIFTVGMPTRHKIGNADDAQNPAMHAGKILRLNDDGTVPSDNPFVGNPAYKPEIYALGIRNAIGLFVHPQTGEIWETENGPMGGDELNIIKAGKNYGWPTVSYGKDYNGKKMGGLSGTTTEHPWAPGMEEPFLFWMPSPAVTGVIVYTGDKFPAWKGNIFVGAMGGANLGARQLHRIVLSRQGQPQMGGNLTLLHELKQRIRDVKQGSDGLIYLTTDEANGAVLKLEPVSDADQR
jgi:aldose sugar dehydrogenase